MRAWKDSRQQFSVQDFHLKREALTREYHLQGMCANGNHVKRSLEYEN